MDTINRLVANQKFLTRKISLKGESPQTKTEPYNTEHGKNANYSVILISSFFKTKSQTF